MRTLIVILLTLTLWLQYRLWLGPGSFAEVRHLWQRVALQQQEVRRLEERNQALELEVMDLKHGMDALEERARLDLGMISQGEFFYQAVEPPQVVAATKVPQP